MTQVRSLTVGRDRPGASGTGYSRSASPSRGDNDFDESLRAISRSGTIERIQGVMRKATFEADDAWSETFLSALKAYPDLPADGIAT